MKAALTFCSLVILLLVCGGCEYGHGPTQSERVQPSPVPDATCGEVLGFLEMGLLPGITTIDETWRTLEETFGKEFPHFQISGSHGEQITFERSISTQEHWRPQTVNLFFVEGILAGMVIHWAGYPNSTATWVRKCLGEPQYYDAVVYRDPRLLLDVSLWYPEMGLRLTGVSDVSEGQPLLLNDAYLFHHAWWVAPGDPQSMLDYIENATVELLDKSAENAVVLARLQPWTGDWKNVEEHTLRLD